MVVEDHRLVRRADGTVVEGLGSDNVVNRNAEIGGLGNKNRGVTSTDADGGVTGFVSRFNHGVTAGGEDQVYTRVVEQHTGSFDRRSIDELDGVLGSAGGNSCVTHEFSSFNAALLSAGVAGEDNHVTGLHGDQRLEHDSRSRVGGRSSSRQHAKRLGNILNAFFFFDNAYGLLVFEVLINNVSTKVVLDGFMVGPANTGFFNGNFAEHDFVFYADLVHGRGNLVDLLLGETLKFGGSRFSISYQFINHCLCHT